MAYEWIEAGLDYLSCSLALSAPGTDFWAFNCGKILEEIGMDGHKMEERQMNGYRGVSAGNCFIGARDDGYFLNLTGGYADLFFDRIHRPDLHYSRVDVQITVKMTEMSDNVAKGAYRDATAHNNSLSQARRRKLYIIVGSDGGDTLYIGSPHSEQRGRIYNKAVQSGLDRYLGTWRWEVVFRNDLASSFVRTLNDVAMPRDEYCLAAVCKWYADRGVSTTDLRAGSNVVLPRQRSARTDVERKLKWLEEQVKPTIGYLCELGFRDTLLVLLGLGSE